MRTLFIAAPVIAALASPGVADAQRVVQRGPGASYGVPGRAPPVRTVVQTGHGEARWAMRDGRWIGGWNAPGGWAAYRRPYVGYALPRYWVQPGFAITGWSSYGLAQPAPGYRWQRYYDDAVLVDSYGSVHDTVGGIAWDDDAADYVDAVPVAPDRYDDGRRDSGLGGAAIGAVAGGVAGNVIAGRGDRLGGTLIGAGVGAAAGYAIDKAEDRRGPPPAAYSARYPAPRYAPPPYHPGPDDRWVSPDGRTVVTTGGYGRYGGTTTTVVVQSAPVVTTTTTTEYYDDHVTYSRPRKVVKRRYRPTKTICRC